MNLTHTHNAEGRKPSLCSFMALSLFQVHCTCPRQGLPSLRRPSLPSFSGAPGPITPPLPPCVSPCPAQPLCQQAYYSRIHHHIGIPLALLPSSGWPSWFFLLFWCWRCQWFSPLPTRRISNLCMEQLIGNLFISVPSQFPIHGSLLFLLFPSSQWALWSIPNKISDDNSKTIGGVFSLEYLCFSTGYMGSIVQITSSICSLHL